MELYDSFDRAKRIGPCEILAELLGDNSDCTDSTGARMPPSLRTYLRADVREPQNTPALLASGVTEELQRVDGHLCTANWAATRPTCRSP